MEREGEIPEASTLTRDNSPNLGLPAPPVSVFRPPTCIDGGNGLAGVSVDQHGCKSSAGHLSDQVAVRLHTASTAGEAASVRIDSKVTRWV